MSEENILDSELTAQSNPNQIRIDLLSTNKFIILSVFSFGLYEIWWMYKSWKLLKEKDNLDVWPVARALFGVLFSFTLFERILPFAKSN